jgi:GntR family transcriptional regulator, histidine utilization repressor
MADQPRYSEIRNDLESLIVSGEWPPGHPVPSEHQLADRYGVARMTVNKALTELASAGLIVRKRRSGSFVASPQGQQMVMTISDIRDEIKATGHVYRYELLSRNVRAASAEESRQLSVSRRSRLVVLEALHFANDAPFAFERRLINLMAVPDAESADFKAESGGAWLLRRVPWTRAEHVIRATPVEGETAKRLKLKPGASLLVIARRTWLAGQVVTSVNLHYPGHMHELKATFVPGAQQAI